LVRAPGRAPAIPLWFFAVAAVLAILCFPAGMLAGRQDLAGAECTPDNLCFSADEVGWWWNGLLGVLAIGALALLTGAARRGARRSPPAPLSSGTTADQGYDRTERIESCRCE
jgi:hypothetical protein